MNRIFDMFNSLSYCIHNEFIYNSPKWYETLCKMDFVKAFVIHIRLCLCVNVCMRMCVCLLNAISSKSLVYRFYSFIWNKITATMYRIYKYTGLRNFRQSNHWTSGCNNIDEEGQSRQRKQRSKNATTKYTQFTRKKPTWERCVLWFTRDVSKHSRTEKKKETHHLQTNAHWQVKLFVERKIYLIANQSKMILLFDFHILIVYHQTINNSTVLNL